MTNFKKSALAAFVLLISLAGCKKDEENPAPNNETEVITTMILSFVKQGTTDTLKATYKDIDGDGPKIGTIGDISLVKGTAYNLSVHLLNESDPSDIKDTNKEIEEESADHQFFFTINPPSLATHSYTDKDKNGNPIGLKNTFTTSSAAGKGTLKVTLKHQPDLKSSTSTINTGETDIEQTFKLTVTE